MTLTPIVVTIAAELPASSAHVIFRDPSERLFLQFRNGSAAIDPLAWALWGGRIEQIDLSPAHAACREVYEELGLSIALGDLEERLTVCDPIGFSSHIFCYRRPITWNDVSIREGAGGAFFSRAEVAQLDLPPKLRELLRTADCSR